MIDFASSFACRSGAHCRQCRDLQHGRAWRLRLAATHTLPPNAPDFDCPHGKPWGFSHAPCANCGGPHPPPCPIPTGAPPYDHRTDPSCCWRPARVTGP